MLKIHIDIELPKFEKEQKREKRKPCTLLDYIESYIWKEIPLFCRSGVSSFGLEVRFQRRSGDLAAMLNQKAGVDKLYSWIDGEVAGLWGNHQAARVLHICLTGFDAAVLPGQPRMKPWQYAMKVLKQVPSAGVCRQYISHLPRADLGGAAEPDYPGPVGKDQGCHPAGGKKGSIIDYRIKM